MGREIRAVPKDWDHPMENGDFIPLYDCEYETEAGEWMRDAMLWADGKHKDQDGDYKFYWEYAGMPPRKESYRPKWIVPADHYQIYETVSEGTPVSPVFKSLEAMIDWMTSPIDRSSKYNRCQDWQSMQGMTRDQAEKFCKNGSSASMFFSPATGIVAGHRL